MRTLTLLFLLFSAQSVLAERASVDSCQSCIERKQSMCAEECELTKPEQARECQRRCISGYCSHRCAANAAELEGYMAPDCESCLDQQFALCESSCKVGTARTKAICQVDCSKARCGAVCPSSAADRNHSKR